MDDDQHYADYPPEPQLTDKQRRLIDEYMIDLNKRAAFQRAGYTCSNPAKLPLRVAKAFRPQAVKQEIRRRVDANAEKCRSKSPLDVMLGNMSYWTREAERSDVKPGYAAMARHMAQGCARDAAPYVHPRLQTIAHIAPTKRSIDDFSDDELAVIR